MLTKEYNYKMLRATKDEAKRQYHQRLRRINEIKSELQQTVSNEDQDTIERITEKSRENKFLKESQRLKEKFEKLHTRKARRDENETQSNKLQHEVYDLTKEGIDEDVRAYLKLGPNFCETPRRIPYEKIVIETENMCKVIQRRNGIKTRAS